MERKKPIDARIGQRLMEIRMAREMPRRDLARELSLTPRLIRYLEAGAVGMTVDRLTQCARVLQCKPVDFLPGARETVPASSEKSAGAARRQRRSRALRKRGQRVVRLEVHEHDLALALILSGRLTETEALRQDLVERELGQVLREWAARWLAHR